MARTIGRKRVKPSKRDQVTARLQVRPSEKGFTITGKDTRGRTVKVGVKSMVEAAQAVSNIKAGRGPFHGFPAKVIGKKRPAATRRRSDVDTLAETAVVLPLAGAATILASRLGS